MDTAAQPEPLAEKKFPGELDQDFDTVLGLIDTRAISDAPALIKLAMRLLAPLGKLFARGGKRDLQGKLRGKLQGKIERKVAFDGFQTPIHDEKTERDRRYGTVYTVAEFANAYLVRLEMPRRLPASSLKQQWNLPDEMPDYDYNLTVADNLLTINASVRGEAIRRLSYISSAFPADFTTRIDFAKRIVGFRHRMQDKVLQVILMKEISADIRHAA